MDKKKVYYEDLTNNREKEVKVGKTKLGYDVTDENLHECFKTAINKTLYNQKDTDKIDKYDTLKEFKEEYVDNLGIGNVLLDRKEKVAVANDLTYNLAEIIGEQIMMEEKFRIKNVSTLMDAFIKDHTPTGILEIMVRIRNHPENQIDTDYLPVNGDANALNTQGCIGEVYNIFKGINNGNLEMTDNDWISGYKRIIKEAINPLTLSNYFLNGDYTHFLNGIFDVYQTKILDIETNFLNFLFAKVFPKLDKFTTTDYLIEIGNNNATFAEAFINLQQQLDAKFSLPTNRALDTTLLTKEIPPISLDYDDYVYLVNPKCDAVLKSGLMNVIQKAEYSGFNMKDVIPLAKINDDAVNSTTTNTIQVKDFDAITGQIPEDVIYMINKKAIIYIDFFNQVNQLKALNSPALFYSELYNGAFLLNKFAPCFKVHFPFKLSDATSIRLPVTNR